MTACIPHKDTLFFLAQTQRNFISAHNEGRQADAFLFPAYPLFAFLEDDSWLSEQVRKLCIGAPQTDGHRCFFPLSISTERRDVSAQIVFATSRLPMQKASRPFAEQEAFPLFPRIFRTASVTVSGYSWQLFDERWHKIRSR